MRESTSEADSGTDAGSLRGVLPVSVETIRLFLHVLAATVWVGGQLTLAGLVPGLRDVAATHPRRRPPLQPDRVAGVCGADLHGHLEHRRHQPSWSGAYGVTLFVKIVVVAVSGIAAFLHARARSKTALAVFGALSGIAALGALFLGVLLAG